MAGIVIIGAGECGVRAAFALRELGYDGDVTLIGAEAALPYERPPLSKEVLKEPKAIRGADAYAQSGIDLRLGASVNAVDVRSRQVHLADGVSLGYDKLLLATGARARLFPGMDGCLTLRTDEDARAIMKRLAPGARVGLIGGGFIGLELAAIARKAGANVTVVETAPRILGRAVPAEIAAILHARHESEGVEILTGTGVARASDTLIALIGGTEIEFDIVIAGVGAVPNVSLAEAAGLRVENGIVVDAAFKTSDPHVFAAGDCCNFEWRGSRVRLESWRVAQDQGAYVAAAMLGAQDPFAKVPWFWSDQYDLTLQVAGLFDLSRAVHRRETGDDTCIVFQCDVGGRLCAAAGIGPGSAVAKDIRVFEKLIERAALLDAQTLADPSTNLKRLLKAA